VFLFKTFPPFFRAKKWIAENKYLFGTWRFAKIFEILQIFEKKVGMVKAFFWKYSQKKWQITHQFNKESFADFLKGVLFLETLVNSFPWSCKEKNDKKQFFGQKNPKPTLVGHFVFCYLSRKKYGSFCSKTTNPCFFPDHYSGRTLKWHSNQLRPKKNNIAGGKLLLHGMTIFSCPFDLKIQKIFDLKKILIFW